jgi:hypothetical protein
MLHIARPTSALSLPKRLRKVEAYVQVTEPALLSIATILRLYLRTVIRSFYRFVRDQGCEYGESVDGKFVRRERDHNRMIGHDA